MCGEVMQQLPQQSENMLNLRDSQVGQEKIRLFGLDAPETKQSCNDSKGHAYACGDPMQCHRHLPSTSTINIRNTVLLARSFCRVKARSSLFTRMSRLHTAPRHMSCFSHSPWPCSVCISQMVLYIPCRQRLRRCP